MTDSNQDNIAKILADLTPAQIEAIKQVAQIFNKGSVQYDNEPTPKKRKQNRRQNNKNVINTKQEPTRNKGKRVVSSKNRTGKSGCRTESITTDKKDNLWFTQKFAKDRLANKRDAEIDKKLFGGVTERREAVETVIAQCTICNRETETYEHFITYDEGEILFVCDRCSGGR